MIAIRVLAMLGPGIIAMSAGGWPWRRAYGEAYLINEPSALDPASEDNLRRKSVSNGGGDLVAASRGRT